MGVIGQAFIEILPDSSKFASKLSSDVKEGVDKTSSGAGFDKLANAGQVAFFGIATAAVGFGAAAVKAAIEGEQSQAQLRRAIENSGASFDVVGPKVEELSEKFVKFGYENDVVEAAVTRLTDITGDSSKSIELMGTAANLAAARHIDLTAAANLVGRAAEGNITPLKKMGITVADTGSAAGNAEAAIAALNERFGGAAQAQAQTFAGKMAAFHAEISNLTEKVGNYLLPVLVRTTSALGDTVNFFEHNQAAAIALAAVIGGPLAVAMGAYVVQQALVVAAKMGDVFETTAIAALYVKDAVLKAAVSFQTLSVSELAAAVPLEVVAGAIAVLTGGVSLQGKAFHEATDATKAYAEEIRGSGDEISVLRSRIDALTHARDAEYLATEKAAVKAGDWSEVSGKARAKADDESKAIKLLEDRVHELTVKHEESTRAHEDLSAAQVKVGNSSSQLATELHTTTDVIEQLAAKMKIDLTKATDDQVESLGAVVGRLHETSAVSLDLQDALAKLADQTVDATEKSKAFKTALDLLIGSNVDADKAVTTFYGTIDTLGQKLHDNGNNLDFHTQKGRENISAIDDTVTAIGNHVEAMKRQGASSDDLRRAFDGDTQALRDQLQQAGFTKDQINNLIDRYKLVPSTINTVISADFAQLYANAAAVDQKFSDLLAGKKVSGTVRTFAEGGWVDAPPGIAVPAIVHGGEFVLSHKMLANGTAPMSPNVSVNLTVNIAGNADAHAVAAMKAAAREATVEGLERVLGKVGARNPAG